MLEFYLFFFLCLSLKQISPPIFPIFLVFKIRKNEVCFSISFVSFFQIFSNFLFFLKSNKQYMFNIIFFGSSLHFQTCILMCIMCLMQTLNNYEIPICNQCHSIPIASLSILHSSICY
jgi:hypothetical protein